MTNDLKLPPSQEHPDNALPFSLLTFLHKRNEKNLQTTFHRLFTEFKEDVLFLPVLDKLLEHKVIVFETNIVKLLKKPEKPEKYIPDPNAPVFDYDERYINDSDHTREELYGLQKKILSLKGSADLVKDLKTQTGFNEKIILDCLSQFYQKKVIKREKIGVIKEHILFRYFY